MQAATAAIATDVTCLASLATSAVEVLVQLGDGGT